MAKDVKVDQYNLTVAQESGYGAISDDQLTKIANDCAVRIELMPLSSAQLSYHARLCSVSIEVYRGDITRQEVDVIVNAADKELYHSGGVAMHLNNAADIQAECTARVQQGGCIPTGQVFVGSAGKLASRNVKHIIHAVGPIWTPGGEDAAAKLLRSAVSEALIKASQAGAKSIAIPLISAALFNLAGKANEARIFRTIGATVREYLETSTSNTLEVIRFVELNLERQRDFITELEKEVGFSTERLTSFLPTTQPTSQAKPSSAMVMVKYIPSTLVAADAAWTKLQAAIMANVSETVVHTVLHKLIMAQVCAKHGVEFEEIPNGCRLRGDKWGISRAEMDYLRHENRTAKVTLPQNWIGGPDYPTLVDVSLYDPEAREVLKRMEAGSEDWFKSVTITGIQRVQVPRLHTQYMQKVADNRKKWNDEPHTRMLFHGTRECDPNIILAHDYGICRNFCMSGMWGKGTYFARNADYSNSYAFKSAAGKQMFLVEVLVGKSFRCPSNASLNEPPIDPATKKQFDSVSGNTAGSEVWITYFDHLQCPRYLITYK